MNTAIVTGAGGFVGSAVVRQLLSYQVKTFAVVHSGKCAYPQIEGADIIVCDMTSYVQLPELIDGEEIDVFYHFAWTGSSGTLTVLGQKITHSMRSALLQG